MDKRNSVAAGIFRRDRPQVNVHLHAASDPDMDIHVRETYYINADVSGISTESCHKGLTIAVDEMDGISFSITIAKEQAFTCLRDMAQAMAMHFHDELDEILSAFGDGIGEGTLVKGQSEEAFLDLCRRIDEGVDVPHF